MRAEVRIREAGNSDIPLISRLIRESFRDVAVRFGLTPHNCPKHPSNCTDSWIEKDFTRGVFYYLLESGGSAVGCVAFEKVNSGLCYLERLAVLPGKRHKGFGRMLVEHVIGQAKRSGAKHIGIGIIADDATLKQWYRAIGFVEVQTKGFPHLPFLVMFMDYKL